MSGSEQFSNKKRTNILLVWIAKQELILIIFYWTFKRKLLRSINTDVSFKLLIFVNMYVYCIAEFIVWNINCFCFRLQRYKALKLRSHASPFWTGVEPAIYYLENINCLPFSWFFC